MWYKEYDSIMTCDINNNKTNCTKQQKLLKSQDVRMYDEDRSQVRLPGLYRRSHMLATCCHVLVRGSRRSTLLVFSVEACHPPAHKKVFK